MKKLKKSFLILAIVGLVFLLCGYFLFQLSKSRSFQFFGGLIQRVDTDQKVVALTFDDAPVPYSDDVLEILAERDVKATFFVIGQALEKFPQEGKNIVQAGHELGNHSYSHQRFILKSQSFIDAEIQKTNSLIRDTGYEGEITFRPTYSKKLVGLPWYLHQHNIKTITWDVEPDTYADHLEEGESKTEFLVSYTLEHTRPGSIILLHPFCESCVSDRQAIGKIIDELQARDYNFVTISELLKS